MKKILICMVIILGLSSCDKLYESIFKRERDVTGIVNITLDNNTEQEFLCDIYIHTLDSFEIQSCKISRYGTSKLIFQKTLYHIDRETIPVYYTGGIDINFYNLSDTVYLSLSLLLQDKEQDWIRQDKKDHMLLGYIITVSNEKLSLFEKDYSMLEKFPEYYGK